MAFHLGHPFRVLRHTQHPILPAYLYLHTKWVSLYLSGGVLVSFSAYELRIYMYIYIYYRKVNEIMKPKMPSLQEMFNKH